MKIRSAMSHLGLGMEELLNKSRPESVAAPSLPFCRAGTVPEDPTAIRRLKETAD